MSTFEIPNNIGQVRIAQRSETSGELLETFSLDLNNPIGKIKTSKQLTKILDEVTDLDNSRVQAIAVYYKQGSLAAPRYFVVGEGIVLTCPTTQDPTDASNWQDVDDAFAGFWDESGIGEESDAVVFDDKLIISKAQDLHAWDGGADDADWGTTVANLPALTSGYPHTLHSRNGNGGEFLFVTDANLVHYTEIVGGSGNASTVTLAADQVACCIDSGVSATWVGTFSQSSNDALVYEIYTGEELDGNPVARNAYKIDGRAVLSLAVLNNVPHIITDRGNLQAFNGAGFTTVARLPFSGSSFILDSVQVGNVNLNNDRRPVHPKGMRAYNDSLFININTEAETTGADQLPYAHNTPSGIYEYNATTGQLHHRFSFAGAKVMDTSGPIFIPNHPDVFIMAGGEIKDQTAGLYMDNGDFGGYFTTIEVESGTLQDAYESVYAKAKTLTGNDNFVIKYRTSKQEPTYADVTLAAANVINTTDTVTAQVKDEVTIIDGSIAGKTAHITSITNSDTVTSITLDTDIGTAGNTGRAEFTNFHTIGNAYTSTDGEFKRYGVSETNPWIQLKVVFDGDIEMRRLTLKGNSKNER